jgi:hypothetical protein
MSVDLNLMKMQKRLMNIIDKAMDASHMKMIAEYARDLVVKRSMLGKLYAGERKINNPKFSPFYQAFRKVNSDSLHSRTTVGKSNVTFSGQLLDSIQVTKATKSEAIISAVGKRAPYKTFSLWPYKAPLKKTKSKAKIIKVGDKLYRLSDKKYTQKKTITNEQLLKYLNKQGRTIMGLTKPEKSQLIKAFKRQFTDILNKI